MVSQRRVSLSTEMTVGRLLSDGPEFSNIPSPSEYSMQEAKRSSAGLVIGSSLASPNKGPPNPVQKVSVRKDETI